MIPSMESVTPKTDPLRVQDGNVRRAWGQPVRVPPHPDTCGAARSSAGTRDAPRGQRGGLSGALGRRENRVNRGSGGGPVQRRRRMRTPSLQLFRPACTVL